MKAPLIVCKIGAGILAPIATLACVFFIVGITYGIVWGIEFVVDLFLEQTIKDIIVRAMVTITALILLAMILVILAKPFYPHLYRKCVKYWHEEQG